MTGEHFLNTVLVVDDESGIIRLCRRLLERVGFKVITENDPKSGLEVLENERVDLLLADIRMPGMDGFQMIDLARQRQPDLAVVVMTGFGTVETAIEALRRGADGLVLKPFTKAEMVQSVQRALQDSRQKRDVLRLQTLRPLFAITETLFTETNPHRLQDLLIETICGNLNCSFAGVYQKSSRDSTYKLLTSPGRLLGVEKAGATEKILERAETWGVAVQANFDGPGDSELQSLLKICGFGSILVAPLRIPGNLDEGGIVLLAVRNQEEVVFRESDLEIFAIFSRQAAVALENARLHEELRAYIRQVEESQRALIQAEKMAIAGRLTASIAHEINNPLQSVQNCVHLAGRIELSPDDHKNYLEMAQNELDRLIQTVQRMLDYYRPGVLDRKPVDLNTLIQRVLLFLEKQLQDNNVHVQVVYAPLLPSILAVSDQIQQVLLNLILNAIEAMPDGGKINIETSCRKKRVEILIEDSGPGVPASQRGQIFEPFISSKEGGTGLGLAVSYGIVAAHGGSLDLVSGHGHGACFKITFPQGDNM
jgi:two-component system, NtrC family, sensor kinase